MDLPADKRQLYDLEVAALRVIAEDYAEAEPQLLDLFRSCTVTNSKNTGVGFFTALTSDTAAFTPVTLHSPLGDVLIEVEGMRHGVACLVFFTEGYPSLLEGYALAGEDTSQIDFGAVRFKIRTEPFDFDAEIFVPGT